MGKLLKISTLETSFLKSTFEESRTHIDKNLCKKAKCNTLKLTAEKKAEYFLMIKSQNVLKHQRNY